MVAASAAAYRGQLQQLLPTGPAWPRDEAAALTHLLDGWAQEFARLDARAHALLDEVDPRTATELLGDWETVLGLPDPCTAAIITIEGRRLQCWRKLAFQAGQTPAFYQAMAASVGYDVVIHEFDPDIDDWDGSLSAEVAAGRWRYIWRVEVTNAGSWDWFVAGDEAGDPLLEVVAAVDLECAFRAAAPAHSRVIFSYPVVEE